MSSLFDISIIERQLDVCNKKDLEMLKELVNKFEIKHNIQNKKLFIKKNSSLDKNVISIIFDKEIEDREYDRDTFYHSYCIILFKNDISLQITLTMDDDECRGLSSERYSYNASYHNHKNEKIYVEKNILKKIKSKMDVDIGNEFDGLITKIKKYMSIQNYLQYERETGATIPEMIYDSNDEIDYEKTMKIWQ
jgi:hypothetical protein